MLKALSVSRSEPPVSLRLGHARGLTAVQAVIQHPRATALPVSERLLESHLLLKITKLNFKVGFIDKQKPVLQSSTGF